eukprot:EST47946.1 Hexose transporter [Spironucleus salmonicida]
MVSFILLFLLQTFAGETVGFIIGNFSTDIMTLYYQAVYGGTFQENNTKLQAFLSVLSIGFLLGFLFGSLTLSLWVKALGYKKTALLGAAIATVFYVAACIAVNEYYLLAMRILTGYGSQLMANTVVVMIGEHAEDKHRGVLGVMFQVHVCLGIVLVTFVLLGIRTYQDTYNAWWISFVVSMIWPALAFATIFFVPDVKPSETKDIPLKAVFAKKYMKVLVSSIMLGVLQQGNGINAVILYSTQTFANVFNTPLSSVYGALILNSVNFLSTLLAVAFVERLGRKILLFGGSAVCFVSMVGLLVNYTLSSSNTPLLLISSIVFIVGFEVGPGPIFFVFASELFPSEAKGIFTTILNCFSHIPNLFVVFLFPILSNIKTWVPFITYLGCTAVTGIVLFFTCPETKGKTQAEIDVIMTGASCEGRPSEAEKGESKFGSGALAADE